MGKLCTGGYATLLMGMLSSYMKLLERSWNQLWILRLGEERSQQIQTWWELLSDLLLVFLSSVPEPQSVSQGMCGLHAKMIKSTANLPPSEGVISRVFFFLFSWATLGGERWWMETSISKVCLVFQGEVIFWWLILTAVVGGNLLKVKSIKHKECETVKWQCRVYQVLCWIRAAALNRGRSLEFSLALRNNVVKEYKCQPPD